MVDLFSSDISFSRIAMPDADVQFLQRLPMPQSDENIFEQLFSETKWLQEKVMVWGKEHYQPRLTAWYGDPGRSYTYSGTVMFPLPWTNLLLSLRHELEELTDARFNSVLLNLYRDHNDRMGFHSDNEPSLGQEPTIASLSYGATRTLIFKHKKRQDLERKRVSLVSGSMLLMKGSTQRNWVHGIDKESRPCGPRINLTFRNILK
ncbi:alpha-ketoglutarate-dependent dioxygenase AlkB [Sphingomonas koreensis]|nr:alpha-ketoglutarate-dependent dioxygenase AlkB [Sphingomonas koreensis]